MDDKGLHQWPDWYPNDEIIIEDITKNQLFVAEVQNDIIAIVTLSEDFPKEYDEIVWQVNSNNINSVHRLAIHPHLKTPGLASQMMTYIENKAKSEGYEVIRLDTYSLNTAANRFYTKIGYQYCGDIHLEFMPELYHCYEKEL